MLANILSGLTVGRHITEGVRLRWQGASHPDIFSFLPGQKMPQRVATPDPLLCRSHRFDSLLVWGKGFGVHQGGSDLRVLRGSYYNKCAQSWNRAFIEYIQRALINSYTFKAILPLSIDLIRCSAKRIILVPLLSNKGNPI